MLLVGLLLAGTAWSQSLADFKQGVARIKFESDMAARFHGATNMGGSGDAVMNTGVASIDNLNQSINAYSFKRVFPFSIKHEEAHRRHGLHLWYEVVFNDNMSPMEVVGMYKQLNGIQIARPVLQKNYIEEEEEPVIVNQAQMALMSNARTASDMPFDDPLLPNQWHYENDGEFIGTEDSDIDLFKAWEITTGRSDIIVAIVDGGIDTNHEDLKDNLWVNEDELYGEEGIDDDGNGYVDDIHGYNFKNYSTVTAVDHGTHVAGTVGAVNNNGIGVGGVAGGDGTEDSGVRLMSAQIFDNSGSGSGDAAAALVYAADNGAVIAQNSWSYNAPGFYEEDILDAIDYFVAEAGNYEGSPMKGGVVFFAAGNSGANQDKYPSMYEKEGVYHSVVAVASSGPDNLPSVFTTHGTWVDIMAPGGDQFRFGDVGGVLSTIVGNKYGYFQGTSMACPHASGVAALILAEHTNDTTQMTREELIDRVLNLTAPFDVNMDPYYSGLVGGGLLNAYNTLLENDNKAPEAVSDLREDEVLHNFIKLTWTVPADSGDLQPAYYFLWISDEEIDTTTIKTDEPYYLVNPYEAGDTTTLSISGLLPEQEFHFALKAVDRWDNESELSSDLKVVTDVKPIFTYTPEDLYVSIDASVADSSIQNITLKNEGGSKLIWDADVLNHDFVRDPDSTDFYTEEGEASVNSFKMETFGDQRAKVLSVDGKYGNEYATLDLELKAPIGYTHLTDPSMVAEMEAKPIAGQTSVIDDYETSYQSWAGMQYDQTENPDFIVGTITDAVSVVHATRFQVGLDYTFNLTNVRAMMYITNNEQPIVVEIRKGGSTPNDSETVYVQEYQPDTLGTNVYGWYNIPLAKPQRFSEGDVFWIVMHHPQGENFPIMGERASSWPGRNFWLSRNSGRSFIDLQEYLAVYYGVYKVRAYSSGDDPNYVFIDPRNGEIESGSQQDVRLIVDGSGLRNGLHKAGVNIFTNDDAYPSTTIYMDVMVENHLPIIETQEVINLENTFVGKFDSRSHVIDNTGLENLVIDSYTSSNPEFDLQLTDSTVVYPNTPVTFGITVQPTAAGYTDGVITLHTNAGDYDLYVATSAINPAVVSLNTATLTSTVNYGDSDVQTFEITNTGAYPLEYHIPVDLMDRYDTTSQLTVISSDDVGGPTAGSFEDISQIGTSIVDQTLNGYKTNIPFSFSFPYYNEEYSAISVLPHGSFSFSNNFGLGLQTDSAQFPFEDYESLILPFSFRLYPYGDLLNDSIPAGDLLYHDFGDHVVVQWEKVYSGNSKGYITFQTVFFQNGDIEFRYKDVDSFEKKFDALVGLQDQEANKYINIQNIPDANNVLKDGYVVKFMRNEDRNFVGGGQNYDGVILPGTTQNIDVIFDPTLNNLYDGTYSNYLNIFSNTVTAFNQVQLDLTVIGVEDPSFAYDSLSFGDSTIENNIDTLHFSVDNKGTKAYQVTNLTQVNGLSEFSIVDLQLPFDVNPETERPLILQFAPLTAGMFYDTLVFDLSTGGQFSLPIQGEAKPSPIPSIVQTSFDVNLTTGELQEGIVTIENAVVATDMDYALVTKGFVTSTPASEAVSPTALVGFKNLQGYDTYGYGWTDSSDSLAVGGTHNVRYNWKNILKEENKVNISGESYRVVDLPFDFPFYGSLYDTVWVSDNGYMSVVDPAKEGGSPFYAEFDKEDGHKGMIVPMWGWWVTAELDESGYFIEKHDDHVIFTFNKLRNYYNVMPGFVTFQAVIYQDGRILYQYKDIEGYDGEFNFGLESVDEEHVLDLGRAGADYPSLFVDIPFPNEHAILITPPVKGVMQNIASRDLTITFDPASLVTGTYYDSIQLLTNSTKVGVLKVPVTLHVTGKSAIELDKNELDQDSLYLVSGAEYEDTFTIYNTGTGDANISMLHATGMSGVKFYSPSGIEHLRNSTNGLLFSPFIVKPGEEQEVIVRYSPATEGNFNGILEVSDSDGNQSSMTWDHEVMLPPIFAYDNKSFAHNILQSDSLEISFNVENQGATVLKLNNRMSYESVAGANDEDVAFLTDSMGVVFDSIYYDYDTKTNNWQGNIGGLPWNSAIEMNSGDEGFQLTHIMDFIKYRDADLTTFLYIYQAGAGDVYPNDGELLFESRVDGMPLNGSGEWVIYQMEYPVNIPPNTKFYIMFKHSGGYGGITEAGFDFVEDKEIAQKTWWRQAYSDSVEWYNVGDSLVENWTWKIRALSSEGEGAWLELAEDYVELEPGESQTLTGMIRGWNAKQGKNLAKILMKANDPINKNGGIDVEVDVNGKPLITFSPHYYGDTLYVKETETYIANILAEDPEGDNITFDLLSDSIDATIETIGVGQAQIKYTPSYDEQGPQAVLYAVEDAVGNIRVDSLQFKVENVNRKPEVLFEEEQVFYMNLTADGAMMFDFRDMFDDPDNDQLYYFWSNYYPEVSDVAVADHELVVIPRAVGVNIVVMGVDDGSEDGFDFTYFYVVVEENPLAVGDDPEERFEVKVYPNPASIQSRVEFINNLPGNVMMEVFSAEGKKVDTIIEKLKKTGLNVIDYDVSELQTGIYIYRLTLADGTVRSVRVLVK